MPHLLNLGLPSKWCGNGGRPVLSRGSARLGKSLLSQGTWPPPRGNPWLPAGGREARGEQPRCSAETTPDQQTNVTVSMWRPASGERALFNLMVTARPRASRAVTTLSSWLAGTCHRVTGPVTLCRLYIRIYGQIQKHRGLDNKRVA